MSSCLKSFNVSLTRQKRGIDKSSFGERQGSTETCDLAPTFTDLGISVLWDHVTKTVLVFKRSMSPQRNFGWNPVSDQAYPTCFPCIISGVHLVCVKQLLFVVDCLMESFDQSSLICHEFFDNFLFRELMMWWTSQDRKIYWRSSNPEGCLSLNKFLKSELLLILC